MLIVESDPRVRGMLRTWKLRLIPGRTPAAGLSAEEIRASYPTVSKEALQAVMGYAADLARERIVDISS